MEARAGITVTEEKPYYTYIVTIEDDVIYVGKGCQRGRGTHRYNDHFKEARKGCTCRKCCLIRKAWKDKKRVEAHIIYETLIEENALIYEMATILAHLNTGRLLNKITVRKGTVTHLCLLGRKDRLHRVNHTVLAHLRIEAGLSISELAREASVARESIEKAEKGEAIRGNVAGKICRVLTEKLGRRITYRDANISIL